MKYGVWRHEDAFGNSACHVVGLGRHIANIEDKEPLIYVEHEFQKHFAMCIPGVSEDNIKYFPDDIKMAYVNPNPSPTWGGYNNEKLNDIHMPNVYPFPVGYPSDWQDLIGDTEHYLKFPYDIYTNKHNLPDNAIVISIREPKTFWKRSDGDNCEPARFVQPKTFFDIALHFANLGHKVVRIGDKNQTPMPVHENIMDFAKYEDRNILDDLYLLSKCKVHLSSDSGVWPMTAGLKRNLILSNVTSAVNKMAIVDWLPKERSTSIFKSGGDNTFDQLKTAVERFL
jgi:putative glycosyltransferase (TIGR04372 family)